MLNSLQNVLIVRFIPVCLVRPVSPGRTHAQPAKDRWNLVEWKGGRAAIFAQISVANVCVLIVENQDILPNIAGQRRKMIRIKVLQTLAIWIKDRTYHHHQIHLIHLQKTSEPSSCTNSWRNI
jgi:hypothetical protein